MNRKLLALAIGAALSLPMAAQAAPTVYGLLNLSVDKVDFSEMGDVEQFEVNSNSSRIGVMGEENLGNGLSAVYMAEWGVSGDIAGNSDPVQVSLFDGTGTSTKTDLTGRNRFVGLKGSFGTVKIGAFDSPLKTSQGNVDVFNDMNYLDMGTVIRGENRLNNSIGYESPKVADAITIKVSLQPGEDNANSTSDGIADVISASVAYEANGLYLALGIDQGDGIGANAGTDQDTIRVTGTYTADALQLGALLQTSENSDGAFDAEEKTLLLSAAYTMGDNVLKAQFINSTEDTSPTTDQKDTVLAVGLDHNFTQMTKAYAQIGMDKRDAGADADGSVFTVGMQSKF